jgi:hypothetical protein
VFLDSLPCNLELGLALGSRIERCSTSEKSKTPHLQIQRLGSFLDKKVSGQSSGMDAVRGWIQEQRGFFPLTLLRYKEARSRERSRDFGEFRALYDGYWTRFRWINSDWDQRCKFEEALQLPSVPECARHCWKLLMFRRKPEDVWESMNYVLPLISRGEISTMKHNADRQIDIGADGYVIVIYTWGEEQRDTVKRKLQATGFTSIPWRRGCKAFERRFGHWRTWFP